MDIPAEIQTFHFSNSKVDAFIPSRHWIQGEYAKDAAAPAPYWAQVWPAAKALCEVIATHPEIINDKNILELAAGLGLPSLLAAHYAKQVIATDYMEHAVELMKRSVDHNQLHNMQCCVMDWNNTDEKIKPDVLLLSDVNYDPASFDKLYLVLSNFIQAGTIVLLSTPQRLVAKSFMERLEQWCSKKSTIEVKHNNENVMTSVWELRR